MKQMQLIYRCSKCKKLKCIGKCSCAEDIKVRRKRYCDNNREAIAERRKIKYKKKMLENQKKYYRTDKGKAAAHRAYINQKIKGTK